ncbi:MAG: 2-oxoacid:acceptor oxidoreductase family protein [Thermoproteota archaeon]|nr:2-oxoacid:acceptor oxidoreductase family protein [Thermoproteota archaeon]
MRKQVEIRIAGLGGQGAVLAGQILGRAAVYDEKMAVQTQSYGAEARGTAAKSEVIISNGKILFPIVRKCDVLVTMSQAALDVYVKDLRENGILILEENLVPHAPEVKAKVFKIPATKVAEKELQSKMYANIVMLGALTKITQITSEKATKKAIVDSVPPATKENNLKAFKIGLELAK